MDRHANKLPPQSLLDLSCAQREDIGAAIVNLSNTERTDNPAKSEAYLPMTFADDVGALDDVDEHTPVLTILTVLTPEKTAAPAPAFVQAALASAGSVPAPSLEAKPDPGGKPKTAKRKKAAPSLEASPDPGGKPETAKRKKEAAQAPKKKAKVATKAAPCQAAAAAAADTDPVKSVYWWGDLPKAVLPDNSEHLAEPFMSKKSYTKV
jgi:flagellar motor protein MotB